MGILNEATKMGNKTVVELKRNTALAKQDVLEEHIAELEYTRDYYKEEYDMLQKKSDILDRMIKNNPDLKSEYRKAKRK